MTIRTRGSENETPPQRLRRLAEEGLSWRYPGGAPQRVRALLEHELALIAKLKYDPYFLTVRDIVAFARSRGILCQGRGSAANSVVCYCLGVTSVSPELGTMVFERFVSARPATSRPTSTWISSMSGARKSSSGSMNATAATARGFAPR